jgi:hypothetical protein
MKKIKLDDIAKDILDNLKENATNIVNSSALSSPRTVGDAVQGYLGKDEGLKSILSKYGIEVSSKFGRRAMEDMAFSDSKGNYYAVDVKTHNISTDFNMPNLISVKRLATFYKNNEKNNFCILIVSYKVDHEKINYEECHFKRIESFKWECLTIGALGWGQIQITNANKLKFYDDANTNRKSWMLQLCKKLSNFYVKEISKINERKTWFDSIEKTLKGKP